LIAKSTVLRSPDQPGLLFRGQQHERRCAHGHDDVDALLGKLRGVMIPKKPALGLDPRLRDLFFKPCAPPAMESRGTKFELDSAPGGETKI
jgi:hypothetical protein